MKRDMDLVRKILFECERIQNIGEFNLALDGEDPQLVSYHIALMHEAELLVAIDLSSRAAMKWHPIRLTWAGHDFIDAARSDTAWNKARSAAGAASGVAFEVFKGILVAIGKDQAMKHLGRS